MRLTLEIVLAAVIFVMWVREQRLRTYLTRLSTVLEGYMAKALRDRTHMVRIPAETMRVLLASKVRALPNPRQWNRKPGRHPATERKASRA